MATQTTYICDVCGHSEIAAELPVSWASRVLNVVFTYYPGADGTGTLRHSLRDSTRLLCPACAMLACADDDERARHGFILAEKD